MIGGGDRSVAGAAKRRVDQEEEGDRKRVEDHAVHARTAFMRLISTAAA
jgi:hypothetical protein